MQKKSIILSILIALFFSASNEILAESRLFNAEKDGISGVDVFQTPKLSESLFQLTFLTTLATGYIDLNQQLNFLNDEINKLVTFISVGME